MPAERPVLGLRLTEEEPLAGIRLDGGMVISKYELPDVRLALTMVSATVPVLLIVVDTADCAPYPS